MLSVIREYRSLGIIRVKDTYRGERTEEEVKVSGFHRILRGVHLGGCRVAYLHNCDID
jgi:hypothetical protein